MRPSVILGEVAHRPWPLPRGPWVMRQTWEELLFAHWPVAPDALRPLIPAGLDLDTYEGQAWISIVPFRMTGVRVRGLAPIPSAARFPELNVRTYVSVDGKPGVYFVSLEAGSSLAVAVARTTFFLPYFVARFNIACEGDTTRYACRRTQRGHDTQRGHEWPAYGRGGRGHEWPAYGPRASTPSDRSRFDAYSGPSGPREAAQSEAVPVELAVSYRPTGPVFTARPGSLDEWLTARYCLYSVGSRGRVYRGEIHHQPWPLQPAAAEFTRNTMASAQGIALPDVPPLLQYVRRLDILAWGIHRV